MPSNTLLSKQHHFILFLSLSVQAGSVLVDKILSRNVWDSCESHCSSSIRQKQHLQNPFSTFCPAETSEGQVLKLLGGSSVWLRGSVRHTLHLFKGPLCDWLYSEDPLLTFENLNKGFYSHTCGFIFRPFLLAVPWIWTLLKNHFLILSTFAVWRGWEFFKSSV